MFSYVVKEIKIKIAAKFRDSRRLRFEDTKRITVCHRNCVPKSFGTFEKRAPGFLLLRKTRGQPLREDDGMVVCYNTPILLLVELWQMRMYVMRFNAITYHLHEKIITL